MSRVSQQRPIAVLLLERLVKALDKQETANDGERETEEVAQLRHEAAEYLNTLITERDAEL